VRRTGAAVRSRLLELRRTLEGARRGREVLERKRELLLGELRRRAEARARARAALGAPLAAARAALRAARIELGSPAVDAAILAQPERTSVTWREASLMGVPVPRAALAAPPFAPAYGPAGTGESLDGAGAAYRALLEPLAGLAEAEAAWHALRRGLARCVRQLSALEKVLIPELEAELRVVGAALEEEERDEAMRRRRWLEGRGGVS
jgi:V/A-type H+-transporting ATPase subunit D